MDHYFGIKILEVAHQSPAEKAGVRPGDHLLSINGSPVRDELDLVFLQSDEHLHLRFVDSEQCEHEAIVHKRFDKDLGLTLESMQIHHCSSNCVFCFVDQNPPNLRSPLYFKDGDYRMSFLHGNYITANELAPDDLQRIVEQRLFPLYISVHTTNPELRLRMLGVRCGPSVLERMQFLAGHGILMHAQIVLCPGWNDGEELQRTVRDLLTLGPSLLSMAVVPVGLTSYRTDLPELKPVTPALAQQVLQQGRILQQEVLSRHGEEILFFSDEFYLLANEPWPDYSNVEILHQLENGVGMLYSFYQFFDSGSLPRSIDKPFRVAILTSLLGARALQNLIEHLKLVNHLSMDIIPIENSLFGRGVTVSGLLPGCDFQNAINHFPNYDLYLIPQNAVRDEDDLFLDDVPAHKLQAPHGANIAVIGGDAQDLAEAIFHLAS